MGSVSEAIVTTFDEVVPLEDRGVSAVTRELMNGAVPTMQLAKMVSRLALSQAPHHDPADQPLPDWADTWMCEYDRGTDMTKFSGSSGSENR